MVGWLFAFAAGSRSTGLFKQERYWWVHTCGWKSTWNAQTAPRNFQTRTRVLAHASRRGEPKLWDDYGEGAQDDLGTGGGISSRPARGLPRGSTGSPKPPG